MIYQEQQRLLARDAEILAHKYIPEETTTQHPDHMIYERNVEHHFFLLCFLIFWAKTSFAFQHARNGLQSWVYIGVAKVRIFMICNFQILGFINHNFICIAYYYACYDYVSIPSKRREYTNFVIHIASLYIVSTTLSR